MSSSQPCIPMSLHMPRHTHTPRNANSETINCSSFLLHLTSCGAHSFLELWGGSKTQDQRQTKMSGCPFTSVPTENIQVNHCCILSGYPIITRTCYSLRPHYSTEYTVCMTETHQTRQGKATPPTEMGHFLFFSKKKQVGFELTSLFL